MSRIVPVAVSLRYIVFFSSEYYFSDDNLVRDFFMRRKMDEEGYLPVTLIASFHRVQALTNDVAQVIGAISDSDKLEMQGGFKVRTRENPTKWPIYDPKAQSTEVLYEVPPPPLPRKYRDTNSNLDNLNPDVPEFVPGNDLTDTDPSSSSDSNKEDKENNQKTCNVNTKQPEQETANDLWQEVRRRSKNTSSKNKEARDKIRVEREELDFQFDEELDVPMGKINTFSNDW